uniref:Signal peptide protein n=1 Tax=Macrostomum lignano TaxID=282301 RepID=A0A1I8I2T1_9PLAT
MLRELLGATIKLLAMLLLGYYIERAHAGDYFCFPHGTRLIDISSSTSIGFSDNRVVPKTDQAIQELNKNLSCHWIFHFNLNRDELILVLSGFNVGKAEFYRQRLGRSAELTGVQPPRMRYRLDAPAESKCSLNESRGWKTVDETTLEIVQISSRSLIDQLAVINRESRVAQLASFNSSITMRQFLAQSQRDRIGSGFDVHSKVPMNLKQPARIGLFYDGGNKSIYYLGRSSSDLCEMNLLTDAHKLRWRQDQLFQLQLYLVELYSSSRSESDRCP